MKKLILYFIFSSTLSQITVVGHAGQCHVVLKKWMKRTSVGLAVVGGSLAVVRYNYSNDSAYFKTEPTHFTLDSKVIPSNRVSEIQIQSGENTLHGLEVKSSNPKTRPTIVYFSGNHGGINNHWRRIEFLYPLDYNILVVDYAGFGKSPGKPGLELVKKNADDVLKYLESGQSELNFEQYILYGYSLGGVFASHVAAHSNAKGLILEAVPASTKTLIEQKLGFQIWPHILFNETFDVTESLSALFKSRTNFPVLALYRKDDEKIPYAVHALPVKKIFDSIQGETTSRFIEVVDELSSNYISKETTQDTKHWQIPHLLGFSGYHDVIRGFTKIR